MNSGKGYSTISKPTKPKEMFSRNCLQLMRDWKLENLANGTEISVIPGVPNGKGGLPLEVVYKKNMVHSLSQSDQVLLI